MSYCDILCVIIANTILGSSSVVRIIVIADALYVWVINVKSKITTFYTLSDKKYIKKTF